MPLPGVEKDESVFLRQINTTEGKVLLWFKKHGPPEAQELVDYLFERKIYKRFLEIQEIGDDYDLYKQLEDLKRAPTSLPYIDECRSELEKLIKKKLSEKKQTAGLEPSTFGSKAPLVLLDLPGRDWGGQEVYCIVKSEDKPKPLSKISRVWEALHGDNFNKCVATFRVFVHPDVEKILKNLNGSERRKLIEEAVYHVFYPPERIKH